MRADPFVSVVVPTRGRPEQLAECVAALDALDYPRDRIELIVVEDVDGQGPSAVRNRGAERAGGQLLAFTDDDCLPPTGWVRALVDAWGGRDEVAIGGPTTNGRPDNAFATASQTIVDLVYEHYNGNGVGARFFATNNFAVPAASFAALGGFDESFMVSEDRDFCARWLASGRRLLYASDAVVVHAPRITLAGFCRRHFDYGRGAYRYHRARPGSLAGSVRSELRFHRRLPSLLRPALSGADPRAVASLAGLLAAWQLANAAGFAWEAASASVSPKPS